MTGILDFYFLVYLMVAGGQPPDRDTLIAIMRSAYARLSSEDFLQLQTDIRSLMQEQQNV